MMLRVISTFLLGFLVFLLSCSETKSEKQKEDLVLKVSLSDIDNTKKEHFGYENYKRVERGVCAFEVINDSVFIVADDFHKNLKTYKIKAKDKVTLFQTINYPAGVDKVNEVVYHRGLYILYQENGTITSVFDSSFHEVKRFEKWAKGNVYSFWKKEENQIRLYLAYVTNTTDGKGNQFKIYDPVLNSFSETDQKSYDHESCIHDMFEKDRTFYFKKRRLGDTSHEIAMYNALGEDEIIYYKYHKNVLVGVVINIYSKKVYFMSIPARLVPYPLPDSMIAKTCPE